MESFPTESSYLSHWDYLHLLLLRPIAAIIFTFSLLFLGWFLAWKLVLVHVPLVQEIFGLRKKTFKPKPARRRVLTNFYNKISAQNGSMDWKKRKRTMDLLNSTAVWPYNLFPILINFFFAADEESICRASESWEIIHIPEMPPFNPRQQPTVDVLACVIDPKQANTMVRKLNHIAPLEGLRHVKRIRKTVLDDGSNQLSAILCLATVDDGDGSNMTEDVLQLVNSYQLSTFTTKVCKYVASTKEDNIDGITGFSEEDSLSVSNFMKLAIRMARSGVSVVNAAVIVDPSTRKVIASSCDEVFSPTESYKYNVACLQPWNWLMQSCSPDSWHPLRHAAIVAIDNSSAMDRLLYPTVNAEFSQERASPLKINESVKKDEDEMDSTRPYLCTGYDIYFVWEPCMMCSMVIVHQRIRRVFYAFPNPSHGGLGSVRRLQGEESLNHHYAVFRVVTRPVK